MEVGTPKVESVCMTKLSLINNRMLDDVSGQAKVAPRKRKNLNLHTSEKEPCNRLLNGMEPGTYFVPHCHADPFKDETMVMLRGRMGIVVFDDKGNIEETVVLESGGVNCGVTILHGVFHTMVVLAPGTVLIEAKGGPYQPLQPHEMAAWAPKEGAPGASVLLEKLTQLFNT